VVREEELQPVAPQTREAILPAPEQEQSDEFRAVEGRQDERLVAGTAELVVPVEELEVGERLPGGWPPAGQVQGVYLLA
jgi:hypothetical protein